MRGERRLFSGGLVFMVGVLAMSWHSVLSAADSAQEPNPQQIEIKAAGTRLTYLDGAREQREVQVGERFQVVRRIDTHYVVADGDRRAMVLLSAVIPAPAAPAGEESPFVITTAQASISVKYGRRSEPATVPAGDVLEVLTRHPLGTTLFVLLRDGRTGEVAANLVRPARPEERPPQPPAGRLSGPVPLGCEISVDAERSVRVEFTYPNSLGERLGLQPGTRILKVNGRDIHSAADYDRASRLLGGNLRLLIQRFRLDYPEMIEYHDPRND
jgi:hypothetical protein